MFTMAGGRGESILKSGTMPGHGATASSIKF
jgi:hypothetical protein